MKAKGEVLIRLNKEILRPFKYEDLTRLGSDGDGGYIVPADQIKRTRVLLSLGMSDNWEFEKDFAQLNPTARIIGVDHTVNPLWFFRRVLKYTWKFILYSVIINRQKRRKYYRKLKNSTSYFSFFKGEHVHLERRVSAGSEKVDISISRILESLSSTGYLHDVFLEMDIEGAEYEIWEDIVKNENRINCLVGEFHDLDTRTEDFNQCMQGFSEFFYLIHIHGNNGAAYDRTNDFPSVVELTFVNRSLISQSPSRSSYRYPRPGLDFQNNPGEPDYEIVLE